MATGAIIGGLASAGAGAAAAIRAQQMKTDPRMVTYGGNQAAQNALLSQYASGVGQGNNNYGVGTQGLIGSVAGANDLSRLGQSVVGQASQIPGINMSGQAQAASLLNAYQPGQVAAAMQRQTLDQGALQNLSGARAGGALGIRNALVANAGANATASQNLMAERAQEQQALLGAQVAQANQQQANAFQAQQQLQGQRAQMLGLGGQLLGQGNAQVQDAYGNVLQGGLANQQQYLGQQQNVYDQQANLNQTYETNRMQNQQRKANNLFGLGASLIGAGAKMFGGGAGG